MRSQLARHHDDPDREVAAIRCPVLAMQGTADEYGTMEQLRAIRRHVPHARMLEIDGAGHSPHRDRPGAVIAAAGSFIRGGP